MDLLKVIFEKLKVAFNFSSTKVNSPMEKQKAKMVISHSKVESVQQAARDIHNTSLSSETALLSNQEKQILKYLYLEYKKDHTLPKWKYNEMCKELSIKDGSWVGPLNDSKYMRIDGEYVVFTTEGFRYMENLGEIDLNKILLPSEERAIERAKELQNRMFDETTKRQWMNSAK